MKRTLRESMRDTINAMAEAQLHDGSYWSNSGRYEEESNKLAELVPGSGPADTLQGEIMRAATKIYHDLFNNGFGNNWTGALDFLKNYTDMSSAIYTILDEYAGGTVVGNDPKLEKVVEQMVDSAVRFAIDKVRPDTLSPADMFDLRRDSYDNNDYDEEEDDLDGRYRRHWRDDDEEIEEGGNDKVYDPITKKMVPVRRTKIKMGGPTTNKGVPNTDKPSPSKKWKKIPRTGPYTP